MAPVSETRDKAWAWNGIGASILLVSLMVNLITIPKNIYNHEYLIELSAGMNSDLMEPVSEVLNIALPAEVSGINRLLMSADAENADWSDTSRHLSGSSNSSSSSTACGSSGSASGGHHGSHPHLALIFLFSSFLIGAAVMQISAKWPMLQQTVLLFVIGFVISLILKGGKIYDDIGKFGESYTMWMDVDPHLLLFTLLPALLAGDAMTIDTSVAKRVGLQCLFLAGPGVIFGGFGTAGFLKLLIGWDFTLCLCAGAILCATDPVAVVALLKELGANPIITVQIQGESLLNDGTAIVLYLVSYQMLQGYEYDAADLAEFLIKKAMMAWAIGLFIGYFFFSWIRAASDKLDHSSGMIQITLTLCCAYWSFIFVEGVLNLSGVLATVAASLVLAHHMWPYIVSPESMNHVWHTFEGLGNMIVFFLAGAKTGDIFLDIEPIDILNLVLIWLFLLAIRACLMFGARPVLKILSADRKEVTWQDATLMVWGGLRGAVGLALALAVNNDRAAHKDTGEPMIAKKDAERILFFVSGIAFLTTLVNATTAPALVGKLGITALPQARLTLIKMFHNQLVGWSENAKNPPEVVKALRSMLHESEHHLDHQAISKTGPTTKRSSSIHTEEHVQAAEEELQVQEQALATLASQPKVPGEADLKCQQNTALIEELKKWIALYEKVPNDELHKGLIGEELDENLLGKAKDADGNDTDQLQVDDMIQLIENQYVDAGMAKVVNEIFLNMVFQNYWKLIEEGLIRPGSVESEVLMTAVRVSMSPFHADLQDFAYVQEQLETHAEFKDQAALGSMADEDLAEAGKEPGALSKLVGGWQFNVGVALIIMLNTLQVIAEEIWRQPGTAIDTHIIWLILDGAFTIIFFAEMVVKMLVLRLKYFKSAWNKFDFFLVWVGVFGLVMSIATHGKGAELAGKTRIIRVARVLRTLRFLRIFRLFHAKMSGDKFVSMELAREFKKVTVLTCFCRAHVLAQINLVKYFGGNGKLDEANESEIARCILQSQVATYKSLCQIAAVQDEMGQEIYTELENLYQRKHITEGLSNWVMKAHKDGALSATEAHAILHPLNHMVAECVAQLGDKAEGLVDSAEKKSRLSKCHMEHQEHARASSTDQVDMLVAVTSEKSSSSPPDTAAEVIAVVTLEQPA